MKTIPLLLFISLLTLTSAAQAKSINLLDQPKDGAKVVGTVNPEVGVIPIFTSKAGDWVEVGNPDNGKVGWIKSNELGNANGNNAFTFSQRIINTGSGPHSYQLLQVGNQQKLTPQQENLFKEMQKHQQAMQNEIQQMFQDSLKTSRTAWTSVPVIVPVIVMPTKPTTK